MKMSRAISVLVAVLGATSAWAQHPPSHSSPAAKPMEMSVKPAMMDEAMMARHAEMTAKHETMVATTDAMDARLGELVAKMNSATDSRKVDAVAAVVTELIAQRKEMRQSMMGSHQAMMKHMAEHMPAGMMASMAECPMMKGMEGAPDPGTKDEHAAHRPK